MNGDTTETDCTFSQHPKSPPGFYKASVHRLTSSALGRTGTRSCAGGVGGLKRNTKRLGTEKRVAVESNGEYAEKKTLGLMLKIIENERKKRQYQKKKDLTPVNVLGN